MTYQVAITRCDEYRLPRVQSELEKCVALVGGWGQFVKPGARVLLKPNLIASASAEAAAITHPVLVEAVVIALKEHGAQLALGDSPAFGSASGVARRAGIAEICEKHAVPIVEFEWNTRQQAHREAMRWPITKTLQNYDVVINLPKLKAHAQLQLTGAVKNLYGCVAGKRKVWWHVYAHNDLDWFAQVLLETAQQIRPALSIMDGIVGMHVRGPTGGTPKQLGILGVAAEPLALDCVMAELLCIAPERVPILNCAQNLNLPTADLACIEVLGASLDELRVTDFQHINELSAVTFKPLRAVRSVLRHLWLRWIAGG